MASQEFSASRWWSGKIGGRCPISATCEVYSGHSVNPRAFFRALGTDVEDPEERNIFPQKALLLLRPIFLPIYTSVQEGICFVVIKPA